MDINSTHINKIKAEKPNMNAQEVSAKYNAGGLNKADTVSNKVPEKSNKQVKIKAEKPDMSVTKGDYNAFNKERLGDISIGTSFSNYGEDSNTETAPSPAESGTTNQNNPVKVKAERPQCQSTAVQHVSKHFDVVVGIDLHWTVTPLNWVPLPLPHPFVGMIMDPIDYIHFNIPVPGFLQRRYDLPKVIPMGGSIYVHGRHKATTTTSVIGVALPGVHITGKIPAYLIVNQPGAPHDGEVYWGSSTVSGQGSKMSGSDSQHVLTCWCPPMGLRGLPTAPNKIRMNPFAYFAFYNEKLSMYIQINTGKPVLVGGPFIPHKYTLKEMLQRFAGMALMKGLGSLGKRGGKNFNQLLRKMFGKENPISRILCKLGFDPINFATGDLAFEWEDFEVMGAHALKWTNIWESNNKYSGMLGNGVSNNYDLFIIPQEQEGIAAFHHPEENQAVPIPYIETGGDFEYYRLWKIWQKRPNANSWIIKHNGDIYTYKSYPSEEFEIIFRIEKIEYANGEVLQFHYTRQGEILTQIIDKAERKLLFTPTVDGKRIAAINFEYKNTKDLLVRYEYDERGNLIQVFDAVGKSIDFHYDSHNRIIRRKNRNAMEYSFEYDQEGRVIYTSGKNGFQEGRIKYFPEEGYNEVYYTQKEGKIERYYYDEDFRVYKIEDAMGGETWHDYTPYNESKLTSTPEGKIIAYEYDEQGNVKNYQSADGEQTQYQYDEQNRLIYRKEPSGLFEAWTYDAQGRLTHWTRLDESTVEYQYQEDNKQPLLSYDSNGLETQWEYNEYGQITTVSNNKGAKQEYRYDPYGRLISQNREGDSPTTWKRDPMGRVQEFTSNGQKPLRIQYDAYDLPICVTNGTEEWFMEYTPMGSLKKQSRRSAKTLEAISTLNYDYNAYEQLYRITNEKQEEYTFTRNLNDEVIKERSFDGEEKEYHRNRDGEIIKTRLAGDKEIFHEYDAGGRLTYNRYTSGFWESFEYDKIGQLTKATNPMSETEFIRNPFGQITQEKQGEHQLNYIYDEMGRLTTLTSSLGAEIDYDYHQDGYLQQLTAYTPETRQNMMTPFWKAEIEVKNQGREVKRKMNAGVTSHMQYDALGRPVIQQVHTPQQTTLHKEHRWKDNFKLAETLNHLTGGKVQYSYDAFGSLAAAKYEDQSIQYKNPDETGNLYGTKNQKDRIYDKGGKLRKDNNWYYHYDLYGNLRLKTQKASGEFVEEPQKPEFTSRFLMPDGEIYDNKYDQKAEIRKYSRWELKEYDKIREKREAEHQAQEQKKQKAEWNPGDWEYLWYSNGMLRQIKKPDGSLINFEYDALGRRTAKIVENKNGENKIYRYIWEGNVLLHEWNYELAHRPQLVSDAEGNVKYDKEEPVEGITTWVYERNNFTPCAKIIGKEKYSIISDYLGVPVQAYNRLGKLVWERELDIYGNVRQGKEDDFIPFLYPGQYVDVETGLAYNRFRYYSSETGSYLSKDPIGLLGNNPNLYAYVHDSNNFVDIFGLSSFDPFEFGEITPFPKDLHFGQKRVAPNFSDIGSQANDLIRGRSLSDVSKDISLGKIDPDIFQISYTIDPVTGKAVTLNNRGLAALSEGGKMPSNAIFVPYDKVPSHLKSDFGLKGPSGDVVPSKTVAVTKNKDGSGHVRNITNYK